MVDKNGIVEIEIVLGDGAKLRMLPTQTEETG